MVASAVIIHNYQIPANITGPSTLVSLVGNSIVGVKESIVGHFNDPEGFVDALGIALGKLFMVDVTATREEQMNGGVKQNFAPVYCLIFFYYQISSGVKFEFKGNIIYSP